MFATANLQLVALRMSIQQVSDWLANFIRHSINQQTVMSITHDEKYISNFKAHVQI